MLKKLEKLENSINSLIEKLIALWFRFLRWVLPAKLFTWKDQFIAFTQKQKERFINWVIQLAQTIKTQTLEFIAKVKTTKEKITNIDVGAKVKNSLSSSKEYLLKTPLKSQVKFFSKNFQPLFERLGKKLQKHASSQAYIALTALVMVMGGIYGVYHSSQQIYQKEYPYRAPASVQEYDKRPEYAMFKRKTMSVQNMKIPLTVESVSSIRSITMDMSIRTSTRWARFYLDENQHRLKDYFFTTVEPVVSDFPLEEEGKLILKEKVRVEINNFLRENGVEGEVEDVRFLFISAS